LLLPLKTKKGGRERQINVINRSAHKETPVFFQCREYTEIKLDSSQRRDLE
jgi:hypothetical protein